MKEILLKRKGAFALYIVASLFYVISDMLQISATALVFDAIEKGSTTYYVKIMLVVVGVILLNGGIYLVSRLLRLKYMKQVLIDVRMKAFETVMQMGYRQFGKVSKEIYLSRLTNDINSIESKFFNSLVQFIANTGLFVVGLMTIFVLDFKLGLGTFMMALVCYCLSTVCLQKTTYYQEEVSTKNEELTVQVSNMFNGLEIIKLGRMEDQFSLKTIQEIKKVERSKWQLNCYSNMQRNGLVFLGYVAMVGIIFYLGFQIVGGIPLGRAVFLYDLSSRLTFLMMNTLPLMNVMKASSKLYEKITYRESAEEGVGGKVPFTFEKKLEVRNVSFGYEDKKLINHAFFTIEKGKKYLIKGVSGAGKSTLMKLLGMAQDDYEGDIVVDGVSYRQVDESSFNKKVAFIDQDVFLFEDSIRNNITLYKEVPQEKVEMAVESAGLREVLEERAEGIDTLLSENGKNLSGGQRQRIAIARALAKEADILFIDEGTSSLNETLGSRVEKDILGLSQTVIAISHRYYKGVSECYDYVLEIQGEGIKQYTAQSYFEGVMVC